MSQNVCVILASPVLLSQEVKPSMVEKINPNIMLNQVWLSVSLILCHFTEEGSATEYPSQMWLQLQSNRPGSQGQTEAKEGLALYKFSRFYNLNLTPPTCYCSPYIEPQVYYMCNGTCSLEAVVLVKVDRGYCVPPILTQYKRTCGGRNSPAVLALLYALQLVDAMRYKFETGTNVFSIEFSMYGEDEGSDAEVTAQRQF